ncbi:MAG: HEAT repeat domain-containing protein [Planctomycetes bacterium]|nr:HEAT repeat domain-containing protein [Planctomycetota bacterium]
MRLLYVGGVLGLLGLPMAWSSGTGTPKKEDVPKYLKMLKTSQLAKERALGAEMLGKRGAINVDDVEDAIEPLKSALQKDADVKVKAAAATALGNIAPDPQNTVPILIEAVKDKNLELKMAAITALGQFGAAAKAAIEPLREIAKDKTDKKLSLTAVLALKSIIGKKK